MERLERVRFWILVASNSGATLCDAGWRYRLGDLTGMFGRYLDDMGAPAEAYPPLYRGEPDYTLRPSPGGKYSVDPLSGAHDTGDVPRGYTDKEEELFARRFAPEEVLGKRLAVDRLLCDACEALGIMPGVQACGSRLYRLGTRARKSVFVYLGGGAGSSESLTAHLASAGPHIELYVAQKTAEVEACGMLANIAVLELADHLDIGTDGTFKGETEEVDRCKKAAGQLAASNAIRSSGDIKIIDDYMTIRIGKREIDLSKKFKARNVFRFLHAKMKNTDGVFLSEEIKEDFNAQFGKGQERRQWKSDRFREDLFKGMPKEDFDCLFETLDQTAGRYRLKV